MHVEQGTVLGQAWWIGLVMLLLQHRALKSQSDAESEKEHLDQESTMEP